MNINNRERLEFIDITKGIAIILVVFGHIISNNNDKIQIWIYSFHIPIFFIITGILYNNSSSTTLSAKKFIKKKAKQLMYPYATFGGVFLLRYFIQVILGFGEFNTLFVFFIDLITLIGVGVLWFLPTIFIAEAIFKVIMNQNKYIRRIFFAILFTLTGVISIMVRYKLKWNIEKVSFDMYIIFISRVLVGTLFLAVGYYLNAFIQSCKKLKLWITFFLIISVTFSMLNGSVDLNKFILNNPILYYINAISGSLFIIFLSKCMVEIKVLKFFGKNSLIVMVTHSIFGTYQLVYSAVNKAEIFRNSYYIDKLFILVVTMLIEIIIILVINNYFNFLIKIPKFHREDKKSGSKKR